MRLLLPETLWQEAGRLSPNQAEDSVMNATRYVLLVDRTFPLRLHRARARFAMVSSQPRETRRKGDPP